MITACIVDACVHVIAIKVCRLIKYKCGIAFYTPTCIVHCMHTPQQACMYSGHYES